MNTFPFDMYSKWYDDWFDKNNSAYHSELFAVIMAIHPKGEGIEICSGSGKFVSPLGVRFGIELLERR